MATKGYIAARRDEALNSLHSTSKHIAAALQLEPPDLMMFFRDPDLLHAEQLYAAAQFQERVLIALMEWQGILADAQARVEQLTVDLQTCQQTNAEFQSVSKPTSTKKKAG